MKEKNRNEYRDFSSYFILNNNKNKKHNNKNIKNDEDNKNSNLDLIEEEEEEEIIKIHNPFMKNEINVSSQNDDNSIEKIIDTSKSKKKENNNISFPNNVLNKNKESNYSLMYFDCKNFLSNEQIISLFAFILLREVEKFKNFIMKFTFISNENMNKIISNYHKFKEKELNAFKLFLQHFGNDNIEKEKITEEKEKENLILGYKTLNKIYNQSHIQTHTICIYCFKYYVNIKKHIFKNGKQKNYCRSFFKYIKKEKTLKKQIILFIDLLKYSKPCLINFSNKIIYDEIKRIIIKNNIKTPLTDYKEIFNFFEIIYENKFGTSINHTIKKLKQIQEKEGYIIKNEKNNENGDKDLSIKIEKKGEKDNIFLNKKNKGSSILENKFYNEK